MKLAPYRNNNDKAERTMPDMQNIVSSYIAAIGYDTTTKELHVRLAKVAETHV